MSNILIEGGVPLTGSVSISGSRNSAIKLIYASMFSNEDILLNNVPWVQPVFDDIEVIKSVGGKADWVGSNTIVLNGSQISSFEIPKEIGSRFRTSMLFAGPLLFRFGKAFIPKFKNTKFKAGPVNRFLDTWKSLGFVIEEDEDYYKVTNDGNASSASVNFKTVSHMGTDNAILSSVFLSGETLISNSSEEPEIDDLIGLFNLMGGLVERVEDKKIKVNGVNIFKGARFDVCPDKTEFAVFASAAVLTKGNLSIKGIKRESILQFVNFLNKIGARFEFSENELRVWRNENTILPSSVDISPSPGFVPDWQPLAVLILTQAEGESTVHDTVYVDRFGYCVDLNRMGAKIELVKPSDVNKPFVISDDSYNAEELGEPLTVAKVLGPSKLKGERISVTDCRYISVLVLAGLCAEGKSEIIGADGVSYYFEGFVDKLKALGAKIWETQD